LGGKSETGLRQNQIAKKNVTGWEDNNTHKKRITLRLGDWSAGPSTKKILDKLKRYDSNKGSKKERRKKNSAMGLSRTRAREVRAKGKSAVDHTK